MCKTLNQTIVLGSGSNNINAYGLIRKGIFENLEKQEICHVEYGNKRTSKSGSVIQSIKRITYHGEVFNVTSCKVNELACMCECMASGMDIDMLIETVEDLYMYKVEKTDFKGGNNTIQNRNNITAFCNDVIDGNLKRLQGFLNRIILENSFDIVYEGMLFTKQDTITCLKLMGNKNSQAKELIQSIL
jgi:hypothetical protein